MGPQGLQPTTPSKIIFEPLEILIPTAAPYTRPHKTFSRAPTTPSKLNPVKTKTLFSRGSKNSGTNKACLIHPSDGPASAYERFRQWSTEWKGGSVWKEFDKVLYMGWESGKSKSRGHFCIPYYDLLSISDIIWPCFRIQILDTYDHLRQKKYIYFMFFHHSMIIPRLRYDACIRWVSFNSGISRENWSHAPQTMAYSSSLKSGLLLLV